jgi:hypothetical protein
MAHVARVTITNPSGRRKQERKTMPKKKRRRARTRKAASNPTKKTRRKKRRAAANPTKRRRLRARRSNPRRRHAAHASHARRRTHRNPSRKFARRRHRRNPGLPVYAQAGIAAGLAVLAFAVSSAGAYALTARLDPSLATLARNRNILGGAAVLGGLALAMKKSPIFGAGLAAGGAVALAGATIGIKLTELLQPKPAASGGGTPIGDYRPMGQVYGNMGEVYQIGAYAPQLGDVGQVFGNMGSVMPGAPWQSENPF